MWVVITSFLVACKSVAATPDDLKGYPQDIAGILQRHCVACHGAQQQKAGFDLRQYRQDADFMAGHEAWNLLVDLVSDGDMPPSRQPRLEPAEQKRLVTWVKGLITKQERMAVGDPGFVPMRRLTKIEYERSIAAITGVELNIGSSLPGDQMGKEGFLNTVSEQTLTSTHTSMYLRTAKRVTAHARFLPVRGLVFESGIASHDLPMSYELYNKSGRVTRKGLKNARRTNLARTLFALSQGGAPAALAKQFDLHPEYVAIAHELITEPSQSTWVKQLLQEPFQQMKQLSPEKHEGRCKEIAAGITGVLFKSSSIRSMSAVPDAEVTPLFVTSYDTGVPRRKGQSFLEQFEPLLVKQNGRLHLPLHITLTDAGSRAAGMSVFLHSRIISDEMAAEQGLQVKRVQRGRKPLRAIVLPVPGYYKFMLPVDEQRAKMDAKYGKVFDPSFSLGFKDPIGCVQVMASLQPVRDALRKPVTAAPRPGQVLPWQPGLLASQDRVSGGVMAPAPGAATVKVWRDVARLLAPLAYGDVKLEKKANFGRIHALLGVGGYDWVKKYWLSDAQITELDNYLLDFAAARNQPKKIMQSLLVPHPELLDVSPEQQLAGLRAAAVPPISGVRGVPAEPPAVRFERALQTNRRIEALLQQRIPKDLFAFAAKAWRRPLTEGDRQSIRTFFTSVLKTCNGAEEAGRLSLVAILCRSDFLYRLERTPGKAIASVSGHELANRMSYFLWSSAPDSELMRAADAGELASEAGIMQQFDRMRRTGRAEALVHSFFYQWFGLAGFEGKLQIDTDRFPEFTPVISVQLQEQARLYFLDLIRNDRPVTDLITGSQFYLSPYLAFHLGIDFDAIKWGKSLDGKRGVQLPAAPPQSLADVTKVKGQTSHPRYTEFVRADLSATPRRGVWGLAALLTVSSKPLRTDPIYRAHHVHEFLLGRHMPPPPDDAGMLPEDDRLGDGLSMRQRLAAHRNRAECASCHNKFDHFGFALERFDALGRVRSKDGEGLPIDDVFTVPGTERIYKGPLGLSAYLHERKSEFLNCFARKITSFALGRNLLPGDRVLLSEMVDHCRKNDYRFSALVKPLLLSRQFRQRNGAAQALSTYRKDTP